MTSSDPRSTGPAHALGGIVHTYLAYDPKNFPSPTAPPPDIAGAAFEHMLAFGSTRAFTDEELANAIRIDPSMFPRLGPSLETLMAMLRERKARILSTYETAAARAAARRTLDEAAAAISPPRRAEDAFRKALRDEQIADLERLWYRQNDDTADFARDLVRVMERMGEKYQVEELASRHEFTGRTEMDVPTALQVKDELDTIDRLLQQLEEAAETARLAIIDMEALAEIADPEAIEGLNQLQQQVEDFLREEARRQGLEQSGRGYSLSPHAYRLFQRKLLSEIFAELDAARSGRHRGPVTGEGPVEIERTKPYEFGDPVTSIDLPQSIANAAARVPGRPRVSLDDLEIHRTRNSPRCATAVLLDMSGSMRHGGQYINCKRMALALDALIRAEYPGDFLAFFEMYTFARRRPVTDIPACMPKPVSVHEPVVRLKADMADPNFSELRCPQHFTNIQHALRLARQTLAVQDTPNRQVFLITDGLPTAHFEGSMLYMLYPADRRTEEATMREARLCAREGITINIFLLPSWSQDSDDIQFAHRLAETSRGRVFFTAGKDLDRFVLWDYVRQRRRIIA
jgi:uncharacterized protein with von Willebrand factor type A (vWA) domain